MIPSPLLATLAVPLRSAAFRSAQGVVGQRIDPSTYVISIGQEKLTVKISQGSLDVGDRVQVTPRSDGVVIQKIAPDGSSGNERSAAQLPQEDSIKIKNYSNNDFGRLIDTVKKEIKSGAGDLPPQQRQFFNFLARDSGASASIRAAAQKVIDIVDQNSENDPARSGADVQKALTEVRQALTGKNPSPTRMLIVESEDPPPQGIYLLDKEGGSVNPAVRNVIAKQLTSTTTDGPPPVAVRLQPVSATETAVVLLDQNATNQEIESFTKDLQSASLGSISRDAWNEILSQRGELRLDILGNLDTQLLQTQSGARNPPARQLNDLTAFQWLSGVLDNEGKSISALADRFPSTPASALPSALSEITGAINQLKNENSLPDAGQAGVTEESLAAPVKADIIPAIIEKLGYNLESKLLAGTQPSSGPAPAPDLKQQLLVILRDVRQQAGSDTASQPQGAVQRDPAADIEDSSLQKQTGNQQHDGRQAVFKSALPPELTNTNYRFAGENSRTTGNAQKTANDTPDTQSDAARPVNLPQSPRPAASATDAPRQPVAVDKSVAGENRTPKPEEPEDTDPSTLKTTVQTTLRGVLLNSQNYAVGADAQQSSVSRQSPPSDQHPKNSASVTFTFDKSAIEENSSISVVYGDVMTAVKERFARLQTLLVSNVASSAPQPAAQQAPGQTQTDQQQPGPELTNAPAVSQEAEAEVQQPVQGTQATAIGSLVRDEAAQAVESAIALLNKLQASTDGYQNETTTDTPAAFQLFASAHPADIQEAIDSLKTLLDTLDAQNSSPASAGAPTLAPQWSGPIDDALRDASKLSASIERQIIETVDGAVVTLAPRQQSAGTDVSPLPTDEQSPALSQESDSMRASLRDFESSMSSAMGTLTKDIEAALEEMPAAAQNGTPSAPVAEFTNAMLRFPSEMQSAVRSTLIDGAAAAQEEFQRAFRDFSINTRTSDTAPLPLQTGAPETATAQENTQGPVFPRLNALPTDLQQTIVTRIRRVLDEAVTAAATMLKNGLDAVEGDGTNVQKALQEAAQRNPDSLPAQIRDVINKMQIAVNQQTTKLAADLESLKSAFDDALAKAGADRSGVSPASASDGRQADQKTVQISPDHSNAAGMKSDAASRPMQGALTREQISQPIETMISRLESLQILARQVPTSSGEQQLLALPMKIGDEWTEVQIRLLKRRSEAGSEGSRQKTFSVYLNVNPTASGEIDARMDYEKGSFFRLSMEFENPGTRAWFSQHRNDIQKVMLDLGLPSPLIDFRMSKEPDEPVRPKSPGAGKGIDLTV